MDDIEDTIALLPIYGAELLGEVAQYESIYGCAACTGIIVAPAVQIG